MSEELSQGPYVAVRMGFKPAALRTQGTELTTEPPIPIITIVNMCSQTDVNLSEVQLVLLLEASSEHGPMVVLLTRINLNPGLRCGFISMSD